MRGSLFRMPGAIPASMALLLAAACSEPPGPDPAASDGALPVPALPGSLGANLSSGTGTVVLSWLEPDGEGYALRYTRWRDGGFGTPSTVARGGDWFVNWADFPSVVPVGNAFWVAHWLERRPAGGYAYDVQTSISLDDGRTWSAPQHPHRDDTDTEHGFVSIHRAPGGAGLVWLDGRRTAAGIEPTERGMTLRAATLGADGSLRNETEVDDLVCDCCQTDVALAGNVAVAVYRDRTRDETRDIYAARLVDGRWRPGEPVAADGWTIDGCPVNGPVAASRGDAVAVAWFTHAGGTPRVRLARSTDAAESFAAPVDVAVGDVSGRVGMVLLDDGTAVVSWLRQGEGRLAELVLAPVSAGGTVGPTRVVAGDVVPLSVPQVMLAGSELLVVWSRRDGEARSLAGARVPVGRFTG